MRNLGSKLALLAGLAMCGAATEAIAGSPCLFAQADSPASHSYAMWVVASLGLLGLLMLLSGAAIFLGACLVVFLARRPAVIASYLVFLLLPLLLGVLGALKSFVSCFAVIAMAGVTLKQSQICAGLTEALLLPWYALMVTLPSYLVIAIGLFVRTLLAGEQPPAHGRTAEPPLGIAASAKGPNQP